MEWTSSQEKAAHHVHRYDGVDEDASAVIFGACSAMPVEFELSLGAHVVLCGISDSVPEAKTAIADGLKSFAALAA